MSSTGTKNLPTSNDQATSTYLCNPEFKIILLADICYSNEELQLDDLPLYEFI